MEVEAEVEEEGVDGGGEEEDGKRCCCCCSANLTLPFPLPLPLPLLLPLKKGLKDHATKPANSVENTSSLAHSRAPGPSSGRSAKPASRRGSGWGRVWSLCASWLRAPWKYCQAARATMVFQRVLRSGSWLLFIVCVCVWGGGGERKGGREGGKRDRQAERERERPFAFLRSLRLRSSFFLDVSFFFLLTSSQNSTLDLRQSSQTPSLIPITIEDRSSTSLEEGRGSGDETDVIVAVVGSKGAAPPTIVLAESSTPAGRPCPRPFWPIFFLDG